MLRPIACPLWETVTHSSNNRARTTAPRGTLRNYGHPLPLFRSTARTKRVVVTNMPERFERLARLVGQTDQTS
jgi:hypothetical protein